MASMTIEIKEPKALKVLEGLEELELIEIKDSIKDDFFEMLEKIRNRAEGKITLEEITEEVEIVRQELYESRNRH